MSDPARSVSNMFSSDVDGMVAAIAAAFSSLDGVDFAAVGIRDRLRVMEAIETARRVGLGYSHAVAATLADEDRVALTDSPAKLIADTLRINPRAAHRRLAEADLLRVRRALTGEPLSPHLPVTAEVWGDGELDEEHLSVIRKFFDKQIPMDTPADVRQECEEFLARKALEVRPDQLARLAAQLAITVNPDGMFSDEDRQRRRGMTIGPQGPDGMSKCTIWATPALRALLEAFFAKYAEPGACLPDSAGSGGGASSCEGDPYEGDLIDVDDLFPDLHLLDDDVPADYVSAADRLSAAEADEEAEAGAGIDWDEFLQRAARAMADDGVVGDPVESAAPGGCAVVPENGDAAAGSDPEPAAQAAPGAGVERRDTRSVAQRRHDAMNDLLSAILGNPALGTHRGLPLTVVASATLDQITTGAGFAVTASGTLIPIPDLIEMAGANGFYPYLALFDDHKNRALYLGKARRLASGDQYLMLVARERGCSRPGCHQPADRCDAHHTEEWATHRRTDIDFLTLACKVDHRLVGGDGWDTTMGKGGVVEWTPPAQYPRNTPNTNSFHHPERYLSEFEKDGDPPEDAE